MKKSLRNSLFFGTVLLIIFIIFFINYFQGDNHLTTKELEFLSKNSVLYIQKTCGHCINQELLLQEELKYHKIDLDIRQYFTLFDCSEDLEKRNYCFNNPNPEKNLIGTPTWEIQGNLYTGYKTINQLKEIIKNNG
jgi:hypothetical protein